MASLAWFGGESYGLAESKYQTWSEKTWEQSHAPPCFASYVPQVKLLEKKKKSLKLCSSKVTHCNN